MLNTLFIILLSATTISSLQCAEQKKISKQKSEKNNKLKKTKSLSTNSTSSINNNVFMKHPLIIATCNKEYDRIRSILRDPYLINFNEIKDQDDNTPFHLAAKNNDQAALELFFLDPRSDFSILNKENKTVHNLVNISNILLRKKIFARITLNTTINKTCIPLRSLYKKTLFPIERIVTHTKNTINKTDQMQPEEDRKLPQEALLPPYATNPFIEKMIYFCLNLSDKS